MSKMPQIVEKRRKSKKMGRPKIVNRDDVEAMDVDSSLDAVIMLAADAPLAARLADVTELAAQFDDSELAPDDILLSSHVFSFGQNNCAKSL